MKAAYGVRARAPESRRERGPGDRSAGRAPGSTPSAAGPGHVDVGGAPRPSDPDPGYSRARRGEPGVRPRSDAGARRRRGMRPAPGGRPEPKVRVQARRGSLRSRARALPSSRLRFPFPEVSENPCSRSRAARSPQASTRGGAAARRPQRARPRERGRARARSHLAAARAALGRRGRKAPPPGPPPAPAQPIGVGRWPRVGRRAGGGACGG